MRILYCHHGYFPLVAGAEAMTYRVARVMQQRGHTVKVVCQSAGETIETYIHDDLEITCFPQLNPTVLQTYLCWRPEIVHAVDAVWPEYLWEAKALADAWRVPFAITPASTLSTWTDQAAGLAVCKEANVLFVLTKAEGEQLVQCGLAPQKLVLIGQGPQLTGEPDPEDFRRRYGINGPMVLFLGRKAHFKGYKLLLEATKHVWSQYPTTAFVFIGPCWDADCAEVFAAFAEPRIIEIDQVGEQEKHNALAACDLLCLPSTADVFPLVYVEAWSCGKPVIASYFPGVQEIVRHGQDGLIVAPESAAIAEAIQRLLCEPHQRHMMGRAGLERVKKQLNWNVVADHIEAAYTTICTL